MVFILMNPEYKATRRVQLREFCCFVFSMISVVKSVSTYFVIPVLSPCVLAVVAAMNDEWDQKVGPLLPKIFIVCIQHHLVNVVILTSLVSS
jgi:hypothetical protein